MRFSLIILFAFLGVNGVAQIPLATKSKRAIELYTEADNYRVRGQYDQAIALLKQAIDKDEQFVEAYYRLGITYMGKREFSEAINALEKGLSLTTDIRKQRVFWFDLGEAYFTQGQYEKAGPILEKFVEAETTNKQKVQRARQLLGNVMFALENAKTAAAYKQRTLSDTVNRFFMQYFPVLTADQKDLIFTRREGASDAYDEDLVLSTKDENGKWSTPQSISDNINSPLNEGTCSVSADGRRIIFTSCSGREGFGSCDLFQSEKIGDKWTKPENLGPGVNSVEWESQPSLSADGRTLYFVSDRRGGQGRRDIWVSTLGENGKWGRAKNVGSPINTVYDEISPFVHVNGRTLFFASNGLAGFGGYDLFFSDKDSSKWSAPVNIGAPINTNEDQFSLFITADGKKGYYSHEETGKANSRSKIIEVEIPTENRIKFASNYVQGKVRDKQTGAPLRARIEMIDLNTGEVQSLVYSDSVTGDYLIVLTQGSEYALYVTKPSYLFQNVNFNYSEVQNFEPIRLDVELERVREGSVAILKNIFFDHDQYVLKPKSVTELQKIKRFLEENPTLKVEIGGHTDNTGSAAYNQQLSEKRALAVQEYLATNGIPTTRLKSRGYGAAKPIADNSTEDGRASNRRIEFKLIH